jgi:hypothetical protein
MSDYDPSSGDPGGGGEPPAEPPTPESLGYTPESVGITLGSNPCLDQCWRNFEQCIRNSTNPQECLAQLSYCQRNCAEQAPPEPPPAPAPQQCGQGPCPTCETELQMSNACVLEAGHGGSHQCSEGHSF